MAAVNLGSDNSQEVDLNIAPILDCFVVLITFLLVSASFLSLGVLDAGISAAGKESTQTQPPPVTITVEVLRSQEVVVKLSGQSNQTLRVPASVTKGSDGKDVVTVNREALTAKLGEIHKRWPTVNAATLTASGNVDYKSIVQTMDITRGVIPAVLLGGF